MHFSTLVFALSLSTSARAFSVYHKDAAKEYYSDNEACFKALTVDLKCNEAVVDLNETGWQGSLEDDEDNTITDSICSKTCHQSLQQWVAGVEKDCKGERIVLAERMPGGWEQLCDKDIAGRYCNEVIDTFLETDEDEEWPLKYVCDPCYVRRLWMFDLSEYSPAQGHFLNQRDRVLQGCPEIAKKEVPATDLKRTESELTESGQATSKVPQTANGGIKTTASSESITAPTATSSSESTTAAPTESNASEKLGKGYLLGCWSFMLFLGINGF
ncbi:hypothetical protein BKA59DRAFT_523611 [Fusarium tricinctum]|uniref:Uncharacterized protein n=1 Tax=Fusarium tricinctum TaxID=61284 RepID=A0A8K0RVV0_9HYPO|nr:hypothetical protein BKA59DRAFT_523611 [Fusarium tricinctum]